MTDAAAAAAQTVGTTLSLFSATQRRSVVRSHGPLAWYRAQP